MSRFGKGPIIRNRRPVAPTPRWTVRLDGDVSRRLVGGKAYGLARLKQARFDVPKSFCVTTYAFEHIVGELASHSSDIEELRQAIMEAPLPDELIDEIETQMEFVGASKWAVRSSARAEDTEKRSFAGQAISVLDVEGTDNVLDALRQVWAGHFSMERLLYLAEGSVSVTPLPTAVLIQEMLDPAVAGVLFTVNPLTADDTEAVVTSARGLGEAVVTGQRGDTHYIDKHSGYVRRHVGDEPQALLGDERLQELAACARGVETALGGARDIEWAYAFTDDQPHHPRLFLLQARPITAERTERSQETVWTNANVGEALPGVATPLTWSIIHDFNRRGFEQAFGTLGLTVPDDCELVGSFRGRIYLNLSQFMSIASGQPLFKPERLYSMAGGGGVELVRDIYQRRSRRQFFKRLPLTISRVLGAQLSMPLIAPLWGKYFTKKVEEFFDRNLERLDRAALAGELEHLDVLFERTGLVMLSTSSNFLMSYVVAAELLRLIGGDDSPRYQQELFSGLQVKSAEPGLALLELGRIARRSLRLRRIITETPPKKTLNALHEAAEYEDVATFLAALDDFRHEHGHRAPREAELATPRWREDTSFLFEVVRSFVEASHLPSSTEVDRQRKQKKQAARKFIDELVPGGLEGILKAIIAFTRSNARRREYMRDRVVDSLDIYRHFFLECGRRLVDTGALRRRDDVFFLTRDELEDWIEDPAAAQAFPFSVLVRRALYDHFQRQSDPPDTFLRRGTEMIAAEDASDRIALSTDEADGRIELSGLPGSPGRVTGKARVIVDPHTEDAIIQPGEILVAPYTDVGWTPLFLTASGVVMSLGGPLSHSCIVAREYDIPTVVNAKGATDVITTGDQITVDGDRGIVYVYGDD